MKLLHICNDYCGSKVHFNLYRQLSKLNVDQTVYTYYRDASLTGKNSFDANNVNIIYRPILNKWHRLLYHKKLWDVKKDLIQQVDCSKYDLIHATTLFSDGPIALHILKKYGVPYVVTVRNTDINEFLGLAPHTWNRGLAVLKHAKKIVFISKAPMEKFCRHIAIKPILNNIKDKFVLQPNGIDDFWLENIVNVVPEHNEKSVIYVGKFDKNKNVVRLIKAIIELKSQFPELCLHLVGGDGSNYEKVQLYSKQYPDTIIYHGKIYDKHNLMELYRQCSIFAMPSIHETFGLVYIEALSQHLAVIYTKNQGIDGLLDERVGEKVNALSRKSIKKAIVKILNNRENYMSCEVMNFQDFDWSRIAVNYLEIYNESMC